MSESGDASPPKRELTAFERYAGVEQAKIHSGLANFTYNTLIRPAVWFRENVSFPENKGSLFN